MTTKIGARVVELVLALSVVGVLIYRVIAPMLPVLGLNSLTTHLTSAVPSIPVALAPTVQVSTEPNLPTLGTGAILPGAGLEVQAPTGTSVTLWNPDAAQILGVIAPGVITGLVTIAVLTLLLLMVRSVRTSDPFVPANAQRLLAIAALVAIGGQGSALLTAWGRRTVLNDPAISAYVQHDWSISFTPLLAGLGIAVAAEVFRRGSALRADAVGVV